MSPQEMPPPFALFRMITGYYVSRAIHVVAKLGIADLLADGARGHDDLAKATGTHAPSLNRVLRLLASAGVFTEEEDGSFALTPIGACLRSGVPGSMRAAALLFGGITQQAWGDLLYSVETGEPAFRRVFGMDPFDYMAEHPDEAANFDAAMADFTKHIAIAVAAAYDFSPFRRIVDVGGGNGALLAGILKANPTLTGVLFDLPEVADRATAPMRELGLADRCEIVGGDFFKAVPAGGDAYLLKHVIHDWNDDRATAILRNCRRAMGADGQAADRRRRLPAAHRPVGRKPRRRGERRQHARLHRRPPTLGSRVPHPLRRRRLPADADRSDADAGEGDRGCACMMAVRAITLCRVLPPQNPGPCRHRGPGSFHRENTTPRASPLPRGPASARLSHEQPLVAPQVVHFMHVPLRTRVKLPHSPQASPS